MGLLSAKLCFIAGVRVYCSKAQYVVLRLFEPVLFRSISSHMCSECALRCKEFAAQSSDVTRGAQTRRPDSQSSLSQGS